MSTESQHNGLSADDRSDIRSVILGSREMLESEFERQLERYGIYDDKRVPLNKLGHLPLQDRETRREIDAALERELEATGDYQRAYRNYVREATKEYLNRYVGLKTIEARELVTETLRTRAEYGGRSYMHYTVDEIAGELTDTSDDGLGVALDLVYQEIGAEIQVLFEDTDYTAIEPDFAVRRDILNELGELDEEVWKSDETIGWVYQYFGEHEREEIDDRIDDENYKVQDTDIATKTQLFTPRYIVEWMVDNSLGRLWLEMHGDETAINDEEQCFYLAPLEESLIDRDVKDVRDITVLDPACGSGHMLLYAFDVLYEMYLEQGNVPKEHIPREILKNNLYGIDIDPGAVQIAALSLYTKAKAREPDVDIEQINIISADAVLVNGEKKQAVIDRVDTELEKRVLEQVWQSFENIREWGSLVRIEERIEEIIEEERKEIEMLRTQGQSRFTSEGEMTTQSSFISGTDEISWEALKARLLERIRELAAEALEADDTVQEMFAGEVEKSVELLDYFVGDYDVVVSNPPYLGSKKTATGLKQYIKDNYLGTRNTYAAFIQRCWEFAGENSYATLVTPEDYMFLYSYRKLRNSLVNNHQIIEGSHLSGHSFSMKDRPFTIPFVLRNRSPSEFEFSRFYRLTDEQDDYSTYEDKIRGLRAITRSNRRSEDHDDVYTIDQNTFAEIGRTPFVYWFGRKILNLFDDHQQLSTYADVVQGLATGDDDRFTRCWWEVTDSQIGDKYSWLVMSGSDRIYYNSPNRLVLWENSGEEIKDYVGSRPQNEEYYGSPGITFRRSTKRFTARLHPENYIFSNQAHFIKIVDGSYRSKLTAYLCSSLVRFILQGLNPGLDFQVGDGKRIPTKTDAEFTDELEELAETGIEIRKKRCATKEINREFNSNIFINEFNHLLKFNDTNIADIHTLHGIVDHVVFKEYGIDERTQTRIYQEMDDNLADYPHFNNAGDLNITKHEFRAKVETKQLPDNEYDGLVSDIADRSGDDLREISEALEVSPYTVAMVRHEHDLYTRDEKREAAGRLLSYYLGCIMGRWDLDGLAPDEDGIVVFDESFEDNVTALIRECIELTYGEDELYERETEIEEMLNKSYTDWIRETFFRYHHCKKYRRRGQRIPIYWQLESDEGTFSCFLYYHAMDADTLPKLRGQYVDAKIGTLENRIRSIENQLEGADDDRGRELRTELEDLQEQLDDLEDFGERLDALIDESFEPDFEAGIWKNIQKVDEYDLLQTELDKL
jgi:hypothetical protein